MNSKIWATLVSYNSRCLCAEFHRETAPSRLEGLGIQRQTDDTLGERILIQLYDMKAKSQNPESSWWLSTHCTDLYDLQAKPVWTGLQVRSLPWPFFWCWYPHILEVGNSFHRINAQPPSLENSSNTFSSHITSSHWVAQPLVLNSPRSSAWFFKIWILVWLFCTTLPSL